MIDGKRIKKTEWIESLQEYHTTIYGYSGTNIIYEKNVTTGYYATYLYGPTGKIAKTVNGLIDYYHTDHLRSTRLITDESGNTVTDVSYTPFGEPVVTGERENYLYAGKEYDTTGLYYYGARYYDPEIGRFITRDAIKGNIQNPQSLNLYSYCFNNPIRYVDPQGFDAEDTVRDVFNHLFNVNKDLGKSVEQYINEAGGDILKALENLIKDLGFKARIQGEGEQRELIITIEVEGINYGEVRLREDDEDCDDPNVLAGREKDTEDIFVCVSEFRTVAELATTLLHEICHHVLKKADPYLNTGSEHYYIYKVQFEYMRKLIREMKDEGGGISQYYPYSPIYYAFTKMQWEDKFYKPFYEGLMGVSPIPV